MGFLITVEAPDASGKATQTKMLLDRLTAEGCKTYKFSFPNYGSDACRPVEMYLDGVLGSRPEDTGAYSASVLFAVDRFFFVNSRSYSQDRNSSHSSLSSLHIW